MNHSCNEQNRPQTPADGPGPSVLLGLSLVASRGGKRMTLKTFSRYLAAGVAFGAMAAAAQAADDRGVVQGVVNNAAGQPVAGALVKLINAERHLTFMVPSQEQGRYQASDLPTGQYTVQGIGGGMQSEKSAPLAVEGGKTANV